MWLLVEVNLVMHDERFLDPQTQNLTLASHGLALKHVIFRTHITRAENASVIEDEDKTTHSAINCYAQCGQSPNR